MQVIPRLRRTRQMRNGGREDVSPTVPDMQLIDQPGYVVAIQKHHGGTLTKVMEGTRQWIAILCRCAR
jgi:Flp pilus assembly protein TadB